MSTAGAPLVRYFAPPRFYRDFHTYTPLGLAGACHCSWMMSSRSPKRLQRGGATPHGLSSLVVTVVTSLEPRPKLFQPLTLYS